MILLAVVASASIDPILSIYFNNKSTRKCSSVISKNQKIWIEQISSGHYQASSCSLLSRLTLRARHLISNFFLPCSFAFLFIHSMSIASTSSEQLKLVFLLYQIQRIKYEFNPFDYICKAQIHNISWPF